MYLSRRSFLAFATAAMTSAVASVLPEHALADTEPLRVVATTGMIADIARRVGGDEADVHALMGSGVDPHGYRQTRSDIVAMINADLVLYNGLYLEAQMEEFLLKLADKRTALAVGDAIPDNLLRHDATFHGRIDPHIWMAPDVWRYTVPAIRDTLISLRPEARDTFIQNATAVLADLDRLAQYAGTSLATIPESSRVLLTAHDAFGYFGRAYGLEVMGIQGISTASESGLNRIAELVNVLVSRQIRAVFVESSVSDRNVKALIEGAAAKGHTVHIGGQLYSDAMGSGDTYEGTYMGMLDHNITTIVHALGGVAPERGMDGLLTLSTLSTGPETGINADADTDNKTNTGYMEKPDAS